MEIEVRALQCRKMIVNFIRIKKEIVYILFLLLKALLGLQKVNKTNKLT